MWRAAPIPYHIQATSPAQTLDNIDSHSHSPRQKSAMSRPSLPVPVLAAMLPPSIAAAQRAAMLDPFFDLNSHSINSYRQYSSDTSMPDYSASVTYSGSSRHPSDSVTWDGEGGRYESLQSPGAYDRICGQLLPTAPTSTPSNSAEATPGIVITARAASAKLTPDFANSTSIHLTFHLCERGTNH